MKINRTKLQRPLHIDQFHDGEFYEVSGLDFAQTNLFFEIAFADDVVIKRPSQRGRDDFEKYVKTEQKDWDDVRCIEDSERFANLQTLCGQFSDVGRVATAFNPDDAHYLLVHKLQNERLKSADLLSVPQTRFVMLDSGPAIVQEKVLGTSLWEMYDHSADVLRDRWKPLLPVLSQQLGGLLNSSLRDHLNWNIQNLLWREADQRLYYVDCSPSIIFNRSHNEHNIASVRRVFVGAMNGETGGVLGCVVAVAIALGVLALVAYFVYRTLRG